mmetsp:Transcript_13847/g.24519  ORF Transcript_13847/g.24519 Transcript_13847/m.24519 type:complete len:106 (-) Transcript_13847:128-445(-)
MSAADNCATTCRQPRRILHSRWSAGSSRAGRHFLWRRQFTVFAPTNTAFGDFLEANDELTVGALLNNTALLTTYLNYHVLGSKVESGDIANGRCCRDTRGSERRV